mmetsp:Transcript_41781/g.40134  ORF Transcript_41781/g.40134 Transcript_41781/m.40134 type:complete len:114 (-) Transcript_41781:154-495(-)
MEQDSQIASNHLPNKYLDEELAYMKEIREAYFKIKPEDIEELPNQKPTHEITDSNYTSFSRNPAKNSFVTADSNKIRKSMDMASSHMKNVSMREKKTINIDFNKMMLPDLQKI